MLGQGRFTMSRLWNVDMASQAELSTAPRGSRRTMRLILNMTAAADERLREAVTELREAGHTIDVRVAWDGADAIAFAQEAAEAGYDVVAAAGGDGTVNAVVRGLLAEGVQNRAALAILPFGTANDLATACGLDADDLDSTLELLEHGVPKTIDIGRMNGLPFINVASGGCAAEVTTETDPGMKKLLGGLAYWLTGIAHIAQIEPRPIRIEADDYLWEGPVLAVAVCNGRQAGGGLRLAPAAMLNDGLLDLAIIPDVPWTEFLELYSELQSLAEVPPEKIVTRQARRVVIEAPDGLQVNLDGEPLRGERFDFTVDRGRLLCLLPECCAPLRTAATQRSDGTGQFT